jgi:hypothetical protein
VGEIKFLLPFPAYRRQALKKEAIPLFVKEGLGEIFERICLLYYGLLSKILWFNKSLLILNGSVNNNF